MKKKKEIELILGIDDAGRGPLIGPMALAGCLTTRTREQEFKALGVKDSKLLASRKREWLAKKIKEKAIVACYNSMFLLCFSRGGKFCTMFGR